MTKALSKLERLREKQRQIEAQISDLAAREKAEDRKKDTRRKILIGGVILAHFRRGEFSKEQLTDLLDKGLSADRDRALFDFLPDRSATPIKPENTSAEKSNII